MMWKKRLMMFSIATLCLAGCGGKDEAKKKEMKKDDNVFTIVMEKEDSLPLDTVQEMIEEKYGMRTKIETVSAEKKRELMTEGKADFVLLKPDEIGFAADEKLIQEVKIKKDNYLPVSLEASKYHGKQYGIPGKFEVPIFVYNPAIIKDSVKTLEQLKGFTKQNTLVSQEKTEEKEKEEKTDTSTYGFYESLYEIENVDAILKAHGYELYDDKKQGLTSKNLKITGEKSEQGLQTLHDWNKALFIDEELSSKEVVKRFNENRIYSFLAYPSDIKDISIPFEQQMIPDIKEKISYQPMMKVKSWVVMSHVKNKDMIQDIMDYLTKEEFVKKQIESENFYTPVPLSWDEKEKNVAKTVYQQAEKSYSYPIFAEWKEVENPMIREIHHFLEGKIDGKTALKNAKQSITYQISSNYEK